MTDVLTQEEADQLIALEKKAEDQHTIDLPDFGGKVTVPIISMDEKEKFTLDISRGRIDLKKGTNQLRTRQVFVLLRLDYNGPAHRNPDEVEVPSPHIHIYREGWGDKWAYPLKAGDFTNLDDHWITLKEFLIYCSIIKPPEFTRGLWT